MSDFGTASLDLEEKVGRTLVRLDRFFQEPVEKPWGFGTGSSFSFYTNSDKNQQNGTRQE
jgi:hypothetical protein